MNAFLPQTGRYVRPHWPDTGAIQTLDLVELLGISTNFDQNMFFPTLFKGILGSYGVPDDGRRTTDDGRRTTDDGRRTTDDGRRTTDDGRLTTDD